MKWSSFFSSSVLCVLLILATQGCSEDEEPPPPCPSDTAIEINAPARNFTFKIDKYEASRSDASASAEGTVDGRACSVVGVQPWTSVTLAQAERACKANGKHLCSTAEWTEACQSAGLENDYSYANAHADGNCNDDSAGTGSISATGSFAACTSVQGAFDMLGNVREWTAGEDRDQSRLSGGGYTSSRLDASCASGIVPQGGADAYAPGTGDGFRCCSGL